MIKLTPSRKPRQPHSLETLVPPGTPARGFAIFADDKVDQDITAARLKRMGNSDLLVFVYRALAAGKSKSEIADELGISKATVAGHLKRLRRELGRMEPNPLRKS